MFISKSLRYLNFRYICYKLIFLVIKSSLIFMYCIKNINIGFVFINFKGRFYCIVCLSVKIFSIIYFINFVRGFAM